MKQNSKKIRQFFAALLGVLLILNSLSLAAPSMVYAEESETQVVDETADEAQEEVSDVEAGEEAEPGDAADEEEAAEEEAEEPTEEAEPSEGVPEEVEEEAEVEEVEETEEEAEPEEDPQEEEAEEVEEEPELLEEEDDLPQYQADGDGTTVLAFTSDIHNGAGGDNISNNRLTTWLDIVMRKYNNDIGVMGFCGDMAGANTDQSTFWTYTNTVMNNISSHGMDGVYAVGNHEYGNGQMATTSNSPEVRNRYKLNAEGRAVSGENYVIYCLGTNSSHGSNWAYDDSQITTLTNYLNSVSNDKVIIILTHFPLHDYGMHRTGNTVPVLNAINAAAVGSDGTYGTADDKKIVFLWGHNHSEGDGNYDQVWGPGDNIADANQSKVYFFYAAAGCMADSEYGQSSKVKGKGLILEINNKNQLAFTYYDASGNNVTEGGTYTEQDPVEATGVSIVETNPTVDEGRKIQLHLAYTPSDANSNTAVTWSSSNTSIATVNSSGVVTGVKEGTATITVRAANGNYSASRVVTVNHNENPSVEETVNITPTTDNPREEISINVGDTLIVNVTNGSSNSAYDFTATFSKNGVVSSEGSTTKNIAAGATTQFTFTGVADGVVDITIQNSNTYGSQYTRKGVIHVTVGEGGDTPVEPQTGDTINIEPTTDNPSETIQIAVGDTLTINVTNGSSSNAYDFTATISDTSVGQLQGNATANIAAGATHAFTVKGLKEGTFDVTIQNENQYGSQYVRKGVVHVIVGDVTPPTPGEGTNYKLVDKLSANKEYLIVNRNTAGSGYALTSPGGTSDGAAMRSTSVTVQNGDVDGDGKSDIYINSNATAIVWKTSAAFTILTDEYGDFGQGFDLSNANPGGYLEGRQGDVKVYSALSYNVTGNRRGWRYITDSNQLQHVGGQNTYKVVYNNGNFVDEYNDTTIRTYLFEKVDGTHTHTWGEWTVTTPASCTEKGVETRTCSGCGETQTRDIDALGHDFGEWTVTTPASCSAEGVETHACSRCDVTETRPIEKIAHTYGEPTWTWTGNDADGYTAAVATFKCSVCEDEQNVDATVTSTEVGTNIIYIATAAFQGKAYTDTKTVSTIPPTYELDKTELTIGAKATEQLTLVGSNGSTGTGTWTSSNEKIATVDENGLVTAVKYGKATIHVEMEDGYEADCAVQVLFN
nr:Ig-like domain-containing protein [Clostridiales bacterium]